MEERTEMMLKHLEEEEIREKLVLQLQKDFSEFGFEFNVNTLNKNFINELMPQLIHCIQQLIHQNYSKLLNLFYRIDLPEERLKRELHLNNGMKQDAEIIAELILKRELQKVVFKKIYK